jgi:hypothetical protein
MSSSVNRLGGARTPSEPPFVFSYVNGLHLMKKGVQTPPCQSQADPQRGAPVDAPCTGSTVDADRIKLTQKTFEPARLDARAPTQNTTQTQCQTT